MNHEKIQNWPNKGEIEYDKYSVRYREGLPPALNDISLKIKS